MDITQMRKYAAHLRAVVARGKLATCGLRDPCEVCGKKHRNGDAVCGACREDLAATLERAANEAEARNQASIVDTRSGT